MALLLSARTTSIYLFLALLATSRCLATDYFVARNGSDSNDGRTLTGAWSSINHAIAASGTGTLGAPVVINVGTGVFVEYYSANAAVHIPPGKGAVQLRGAGMDATVIMSDATKLWRMGYSAVVRSYSNNLTISDCTLRHGLPQGYHWASVLMIRYTAVALVSNVWLDARETTRALLFLDLLANARVTTINTLITDGLGCNICHNGASTSVGIVTNCTIIGGYGGVQGDAGVCQVSRSIIANIKGSAFYGGATVQGRQCWLRGNHRTTEGSGSAAQCITGTVMAFVGPISGQVSALSYNLLPGSDARGYGFAPTPLPAAFFPAQPTNTAPGSDANVSATPALSGSPFTSPLGAAHVGTEWLLQISNRSDWITFATVTTAAPLTTLAYAPPQRALYPGQRFYWRVRYADDRGVWSPYSAPTAFIVADTNLPGWTVPVNGMLITTNVTLKPGFYALPGGLALAAHNISFNGNDSIFYGTSMTGFGMRATGYSGLTVSNITLMNYWYGMVLRNGDNWLLREVHASNNRVYAGSMLFLNVWVWKTLTDENLCGGIYLEGTRDTRVERCTATNQQNGISLVDGARCLLLSNDCSANVGWGIHLASTDYSRVVYNRADRGNRGNNGGTGADATCFLSVHQSDHNEISSNSFTDGGDGVFECCLVQGSAKKSGWNYYAANDCRRATHNPIESTFAFSNMYVDNICDDGSHGFWLGYTHCSIISNNAIRGNYGWDHPSGIVIEHGRDNLICNNDIVSNYAAGIRLWTDYDSGLSYLYPDLRGSKNYTIRDNRFLDNGHALYWEDTTNTLVYNNLMLTQRTALVYSYRSTGSWNIAKTAGLNIHGGAFLGGNYWPAYTGQDLNGDGLGDTLLPFTDFGAVLPGDFLPLTDVVPEPGLLAALLLLWCMRRR